jgi:hypothetical protein
MCLSSPALKGHAISSMKNLLLSGRRSAQIALGVIGFLGLHFPQAGAAIINANSPSVADITAAIASAADGDTVIVPAGTVSWTSGLTITKGITLMGQTTTDPVAKTAVDTTIIQDNLPTDVSLIAFSTTLGKAYRVTGITFRKGTETRGTSTGIITLRGNSQSARIDNNHFDDVAYRTNQIYINDVLGVIDHNVFDYTTQTVKHTVYFDMGVWNGGVQNYGNSSWADPAYYGTNRFMFVEDNCVNNTSGIAYGGPFDGSSGARFVIRHNHLYDTSIIPHGTNGGSYRGTRTIEVYNNDFHWTMAQTPIGLQTGGMISHDNTHDGTIFPGNHLLLNTRTIVVGPSFGGSTGDNVWDVNVTPDPNVSGTAGAGSNNTTVVDLSKNWTVNQWAGFTVKRVSDNGLSFVTSNTATALTVIYNSDNGGSATWATGDQYQIHKVSISMDQPGRGAGDLIDASDFHNPINSTTGTPSWTHQALEPCFAWNDVYTPTSTPIVIALGMGQSTTLQENRDYYNRAPQSGDAVYPYTPYTYPHPLVSGGGDGLQSPQHLHVLP